MEERVSFDDRSRRYRTHFDAREVFEFAELNWATPTPLAKARVAIVTTAGLRSDDVTTWMSGDFGFTVLRSAERNIHMAHLSQNIDRTGFMSDINVVYPIDRLEELAQAGVIGSVAAHHISFMGGQNDHTMTTLRMDTGPAAAKVLRDDGVDVVLLTPV